MGNAILKKVLVFALSLTLVLTMMPVGPGAVDRASAATNYITSVELNYDLSYIDLHTAWTKGEVNARVKSSMSTTTAGVAISDSSNSGLRYTPEGSSQMWGIGDGTGQIDSTSTYYIEYYLNPLNGYHWTVDTMKGNGLTVIANGENITSDVIFEYNATWNGLSVFVPIGKASTKAKVTGVEIEGGDISLEKGGSYVFTGEVKGNIKDKLIIWSVDGNASVNTKITSAGKLTIGEDETAEFINVVATANANILKRARVKVAVLDSAPTIDSITVTPGGSEVLQGKRKQFEAIVEGTQLDKRVTWSVEGALDAETTINENGYLKVGIDETAESITVRATSCVDPAKSGAVTVKIIPLKKISKLELSYDLNHIDLNTAWTEGEVDDRVLSCIATTTDGVIVSTGSNSGLSYIPEGSSTMWGISDGNGQVDATKSYYIKYNLSLTSGDYEWLTSAKDGNGTGLTVIANGTDITSDVIVGYNSFWNQMDVYVPIGKASEEPIVKSVTINGGNVSVAKGDSKIFTGTVEGTVSNKAILWTLEGASSKNTKIVNELDQDKGITRGVLTIGEDETAKTVTVKAAAVADPAKYATVTVTVTEGIPTIDSVAVTPGATELLQGASKKFNVGVTGTQADKSVTWSVKGAECDDTTIDQNGNLTIGSDETAGTITVKATSNQDKTKSGTATVTVIPAIRINELALTYDLDAIDLNAASTEGEVQKRIRNTINTTTEVVEVNTSNSWLLYKLEGDNFSGIGSGENLVNADRTYYIQYGLQIPEGYLWAYGVSTGDYSGLTVKVNGVDKTADVAEFSTNASSGMLYVTVPIGKAESITPCSHVWDEGTVTKAATYVEAGVKTYTCTAPGCVETKTVAIPKISSIELSVTNYTYNGKAQKPGVTVKDAADEVLVEGTDYEVSYDSNVNAGTATVKVTCKGNYTGTITKTFTIKPAPIADRTISGLAASYEYTGSAITPAVTVAGFTAGTDYDVKYSNNINAGTATVTATGKGNYTGTITATFEIVKKSSPVLDGDVVRLAGSSRFGTSAEISKGFVGDADAKAIFIVDGMGFADALAAAPFAVQEDAPILMTDGKRGGIDATVIDEINRIDPDHNAKIYLIGGTGVVSQGVVNKLIGLGYSSSGIERVAGDDRFETAIEVAKKVPTAKTAYIAFGLNYPDALGGGSAAALNDGVILFTAKEALTPATKQYLASGGFDNVVILGGTGAVSASVESELNNMFPGRVKRIAGGDRFLTSVEIAKKSFPITDTIVVATGMNFADALAGGPLAADLEAPMILIDGKGASIPADIQKYIKDSGAENVVVLGGTGAVCDTLKAQLEALIK